MTKEEVIDRLIEAKKGYKVYLTNEVIDIVIKILKQKPCDNAISKQAVLSMQYRIDDSATLSTRDVVNVDDIEDLPSVTPQLKIGRWVKHDTGHSIYYACSLCNCCASYTETADSFIWKFSNYCPDCGAKMQKVGE